MKFSRYIIIAVVAFSAFVMLSFVTTLLFSHFPISIKLIGVAVSIIILTFMAFFIRKVKKRVVLEETGMEAVVTMGAFEFYKLHQGGRDLRIKGFVKVKAGNLPEYDVHFNYNADYRLIPILKTGMEIPAKINPDKPQEIRIFFESLYITNYMNI